MRVKNKGGVTPRDRRIDRRKVAVAAAVAMLFFATNARANTVEFHIVPSLSSLGFVERITDAKAGTFVFHRSGTTFTAGDPALAKGKALNAGTHGYLASSTNAWGVLYANINTGSSIQFLPGGSINYLPNTDNQGFGPGRLLPFRDGNGNLIAPPGGNPFHHFAQFGFEISHQFAGPGFGFANIFDLRHQFGTVATGSIDGGPALPFAGGTSYVASNPTINGLMAYDGWEDVYGPVVDQIELNQAGPSSTPFPSPFAGNVATWDGSTTLTIPVNFHLNFVDGGLTYDIDTFGVIVAVKAPEPSSMLLLGFGVVGLLSYAWRSRKRRAA